MKLYTDTLQEILQMLEDCSSKSYTNKSFQIFRMLGFIEAILWANKVFKTGDLPYKVIECKNWIGGIKTRKETYKEMIVRSAEEFLKSREEKE